MPNNLTPRDVALYLTECSAREIAEVFAYFYESNYFFEEHPEARVTNEDIFKTSAHECGCMIRDGIILGIEEICEGGEQ